MLVLALVFASTDIPTALNSASGNAAVGVFQLATVDYPGLGVFMAWLIVVNLFFAGVASVAVTARITWALARDKAFPYSNVLADVSNPMKSPIYAIMLVFVFDSALQVMPLFGDVGTKVFGA